MSENQLELFEREPSKEHNGKVKVCYMCKQSLPATEEFYHYNTNNKGARDRFKHRCKKCVSEAKQVVQTLRKTAPPLYQCCPICDVDFDTLDSKNIHLDHCSNTNTFRGWLCKNCNVGLGMLGDNIEGLESALRYLNKHKDTLNNG